MLDENRSWFQRVAELYTDHGHFVKPHDNSKHPWHKMFAVPGAPFRKRLAVVPRSDTPIFLEEVPTRFQRMGLAWWISVLTAYLVELNGDLRDALTRHTATQALRSDLGARARLTRSDSPFGAEDRSALDFRASGDYLFDLGMHIRVGDACNREVHRQDIVAKRFRRCGTTLMEELAMALAAARPRPIRRVFLSSDDEALIQQARAAEIAFSVQIYTLPLDRRKYNVSDHLEEATAGLQVRKEQVLIDVTLELAALSRSELVAGFMFGSVPRVALQLRVRQPFEYVTLDGFPWCEFTVCKHVTRGLSRSKVSRGCLVSPILEGNFSSVQSWSNQHARYAAEVRARATGSPHYRLQEFHRCAAAAPILQVSDAVPVSAPTVGSVTAPMAGSRPGLVHGVAQAEVTRVVRRGRSAGVIVYLVQARKSSRNGHMSLPLLRQSVVRLVDNYLRAHGDDIMFLHAGDVEHVDQRAVLSQCEAYSHARFVVLPNDTFALPPGTPTSKWVQPKKFSTGYRHMIRLFTISIWRLIAREGYEYMMRLDDDSAILSPIAYNVFDRMRSEGIDYAYRLVTYESGHSPGRWHSFVRRFLVERGVQPVWLLDPCGTKSVQDYSFQKCGHLYGFYNNFFVTRVGFWLQDDVQQFLQHVDRSHTIYTQRWGDLLWHSAAVQIYMPAARVRMLRDFAYEHATFQSLKIHQAAAVDASPAPHRHVQCLAFGGVVLGSSGNQSVARERLHAMLAFPSCRLNDVGRSTIRPCLLHGSNDGTEDSPALRGVVAAPQNVLSDEQPSCSLSPRPYFCGSEGSSVDFIRRLGPHCGCNVSTARSSHFAMCTCRTLWQAGIMRLAANGVNVTGLPKDHVCMRGSVTSKLRLAN